jgi:branched-chain amino acid transport system permease protein
MDMMLFYQAIVSGVLIGAVYALVAVGLTLVFGVLGIINFAHGTFMMLGMYLAYWSHVLFGINPYISVFFVVPILFAMGYLIQRYLIDRIIDTDPHNAIFLTLGLSLFFDNMALFLWSPDFRAVKLKVLTGSFFWHDVMISIPRLIACVFAIVMTILLYLLLKRTDIGKAIRAAAQDHDGAKAVGINIKRIYCVAFGIGLACVGAAGAFVTPFFYVSPNVGMTFVIIAFVVVVLGGLGSFPGALLGGLIVGLTESLSENFLGGTMKHFVVYGLFILVLLFKPSGLLGEKIEH